MMPKTTYFNMGPEASEDLIVKVGRHSRTRIVVKVLVVVVVVVVVIVVVVSTNPPSWCWEITYFNMAPEACEDFIIKVG